MVSYEQFIILLDEPSDAPRLGFADYAKSFTEIIANSPPHFAVGIFGDWGSGKTTLMRAIETRVARSDDMLPVWFNAWRYEREEHLVVPLLDNLRESLLEWSKEERRTADARDYAVRAATLFGRAARALLAGVTLKGQLVGVEAAVDIGKVIEAARAPAPEVAVASFYHAAFRDMVEATKEFVQDDSRRVVVFIDDLDRCLPTSALQVLESMKLFFDLQGFVFVVGLDQNVIERAIEAKYEPANASHETVVIERSRTADPERAGNGEHRARPDDVLPASPRSRIGPISGADYVKKLFQVPFALPPIDRSQLDEFLDAISGSSVLSPEQAADLDQTVKPHLLYMTDRGPLNPREIKRLINAYTLQLKLLDSRLGASLNRDAVLAIQMMGFRPDWARLYEVLLDDPEVFVQELQQALMQPEEEAVLLGDEGEPASASFLAYMRGRGGALLNQPSLGPYLTTAEQTRSTDSTYPLARQGIRRLKRMLRAAAASGNPPDAGVILTEISQLSSSLTRLNPQESSILMDLLQRDAKDLGDLNAETRPLGQWVEHTSAHVERINAALLETRRQASVGATS